MEERLERSRPLWTLDVLDRMAGGDVCLLWKIHHAMASGETAMRFAADLLWGAPTVVGPVGPVGPREPAPAGRPDDLLGALSARRPGRLPPTLLRELRRAHDRSPFEGGIGGARSVAFASLPLGAVKRAAKALVATATVNDVVLALVAGARPGAAVLSAPSA
jgi:diacylglycerol O-acyltransferase